MGVEVGRQWCLLALAIILLYPVACAGDTQLHSLATSADLGKSLFTDRRLSGEGKIACDSCHVPRLYFQDGLALSSGVRGQLGTRNAPSLLTATLNSSQFWDGRRNSLEEQALDPLVNPREHGLPNLEAALVVLRNDPRYIKAFKRVYGRQRPEDIRLEDVRNSLAAFERTLVVHQSRYDAFAYQGKTEALSASAQRGLALFRGRAQCSGCHAMDRAPSFFSDNQFHSLSVGLSGLRDSLATVTQRLVQARQEGRLDSTVLSDEDVAALGRFAVTLRPSDIGRFRTPSLRNVAMTAPYMHDGSIATLEEAVDLEVYYRSSVEGRPLILTPAEKADLVEFLKSLTTPLDVILRQAGLDPADFTSDATEMAPRQPSGQP